MLFYALTGQIPIDGGNMARIVDLNSWKWDPGRESTQQEKRARVQRCLPGPGWPQSGRVVRCRWPHLPPPESVRYCPGFSASCEAMQQSRQGQFDKFVSSANLSGKLAQRCSRGFLKKSLGSVSVPCRQHHTSPNITSTSTFPTRVWCVCICVCLCACIRARVHLSVCCSWATLPLQN